MYYGEIEMLPLSLAWKLGLHPSSLDRCCNPGGFISHCEFVATNATTLQTNCSK
jgi:hypothetical protein